VRARSKLSISRPMASKGLARGTNESASSRCPTWSVQ
jgi:hypothetical protein